MSQTETDLENAIKNMTSGASFLINNMKAIIDEKKKNLSPEQQKLVDDELKKHNFDGQMQDAKTNLYSEISKLQEKMRQNING
jgi:hypothetical protein